MQRKDRKEVLDMKMTFSCGSEAAHKAALIAGTKVLVIIFTSFHFHSDIISFFSTVSSTFSNISFVQFVSLCFVFLS